MEIPQHVQDIINELNDLSAKLTPRAAELNMTGLKIAVMEHGPIGEVAWLQSVMSFAIQAKISSEVIDKDMPPVMCVLNMYEMFQTVLDQTFEQHPALQKYTPEQTPFLSNNDEVYDPANDVDHSDETKH